MPPVLIGSGPCALRAAASIPELTWLDEAPEAVASPELSVDLGIFEVRAGQDPSALLGECPEVQITSAVLAKGERLPLPFRRRDLARLIPIRAAQRAATGWGKARINLKAREIVGGGQEQRSYQDWVVYRYGSGLFEQLHAPYALKRFGEPDQVAVAVAQLHHGVPSLPWRALGPSPAAGVQALLSHTDRVQGDLEGLEFKDGRIASVLSCQGRMQTDALFWSGPLPELAEWLEGEIPEILAVDMRRLSTRHRIEVFLKLPSLGDLPDVLHVVDEAPFYRVSRVGLAGAKAEQNICCHIAVGEGEAEWGMGDSRLIDRCIDAVRSLGIGSPDKASALVRRLPDYDPQWSVGQWFPLHTRVARALHERGIHLVGRAGAYRWMDAAQELRLAAAIGAAPDQWHEALRTLVDPPIKLADEDISLTRFVER